MQNSKLFDIINSFDTAKINNFNNFLNFYRIKKDNSVIRLFDWIYTNYPNLNSPKLNKEKTHQYLFPDKDYDEKRILNIMSDLLKLTEEFIAFQAAQEDVLEKKFYLLKYYFDNNLNKQFESLFKETQDLIAKTPEDTTTLIFTYQLELLQVKYQLKYNKRSSNYQYSYNALNNLIISQQKKLENLFLVNLHDDIDTTITNSSLAIIQTTLNTLLLTINTDEQYYKTKQLIIDNTTLISVDELIVAIIIIVNYCIDKVNKKEILYNEELIFWYDYMVTHDCILESNGTISSAIVKNYITISIRLNNLEKATNFLEKYAPYLEENEKEDVYNYNKANLLFYQQQYDDALVLLTTAKYKDIFYKLSAKRLYIKIYFSLTAINEKRYYDVLESALNAFKKYIYTTKDITEIIRLRNKSFYKYATKINSLPSSEKEKLTQLLEEIENDKDCADRDWLLQIVLKK